MDHDFYIIFSYIIDFTRWTTELIRTNYGDEIGSRDSSWLIAESSMLIERQYKAESSKLKAKIGPREQKSSNPLGRELEL